MNCFFCNQENPEGAVFCKRCGKKLDQSIVCPACGEACKADDKNCPSCGAELPALIPETKPQGKPRLTKEERREKAKKSLTLASGILMMVAVFFSLIFVFFLGTTQSVSGESGYNETYTVWHFFARAYSQLATTCSGKNYSGFTLAAHFLPVILTTVIAAGTLISVVTFSLISIVKFGLHFKSPNVRYYKYAVAAVFTFLLGATFFDCIHSVSMESTYGELSSATGGGMALACMAIIASLVLKTVAQGLEFKKKQNIIDCILALAGIFMLGIIAGTAGSPQIKYSVTTWIRHTYSVNFYRLNTAYSIKFNASNPLPADFVASYTLSIFAEIVQIALIVLTFIALMKLVINFSENRTAFPLKTSIALAIVAAVYLTLSVINVEFANNLTGSVNLTELRLAAAPVMPFVFSVFLLAISITHKALAKKSPAEEAEETEEKTI